MKKTFKIIVVVVLAAAVAFSQGACQVPKFVPNPENVQTVYISADWDIGSSPYDLYSASDLVVVATYKKDIRTYADGLTGEPTTISTFKVLEVVKGECKNKEIAVMYAGGIITLEEYIKNRDSGWLAKHGMDELSEEYLKTHYIEFVSMEAPVEFVGGGQRYMLFLKYYPEDDVYIVLRFGFGALKVDGAGQVYSVHDGKWMDLSFYGK